MSATFQVFGNWGVLTCCAITGAVQSYNRETSDWEKTGDGYDDIRRIDVDEWLAAYPGKSIGDTSTDILDVGYWTASGQYESADTFHRQMISEGCGVIQANAAVIDLLYRDK